MRRSSSLAIVAATLLGLAACEPDREMADSVETPDTMVRRALEDPARREALLDTMPGGEMVRGDSLAERELLEDKMPASDSTPGPR